MAGPGGERCFSCGDGGDALSIKTIEIKQHRDGVLKLRHMLRPHVGLAGGYVLCERYRRVVAAKGVGSRGAI